MSDRPFVCFSIPHLSSYAYAPIEKDDLDHELIVAVVDGVAYGIVGERTRAHPRFHNAVEDAFRQLSEIFGSEINFHRDPRWLFVSSQWEQKP